MKFNDLCLSGKTIKAINVCGYTQPTEVQEKAIPKIIAGVNLVVRSQTGTGKTAAFGIGLVERIAAGTTSKALVLVPTRELAVQVSKELQELGDKHRIVTCAVYGGQKITIQLKELKYKYDILVATPGRLQDLCRRRKVTLSSFNLIVLDEADHMLDIGFQKEVLEILAHLPPNRVTLLFSATIDRRIEGIISRYIPNSEYIEIGEMKAVSTINEENLEIAYADKVSEIHKIIDAHRGVKTLIFVRTKRGVIRLKEKLRRRKIEGVNMLQGDMEQNKRTRVISGFKEGAVTVLVATNVAARGLHIENVGLIINFDKAENKETHLHRVGRTGRMGAEGKVINLIAHDEPPKRPRGGRRPEGGSRSRRLRRDSSDEPRRPRSRRPRPHGEQKESRESSPGSKSRKPKAKGYNPPAESDSWSRRGEHGSSERSLRRPSSRRRPSNRRDYGEHEGLQSGPSRHKPSKYGEREEYSERPARGPSKHKKGKRSSPKPPKESSHNTPRSKFSRKRRKRF